MEVSPSMRDPRVAVIVLLNCTKFMDTPDLIRASQVSRLWYSVISRKINWRTIKIKSCSTSNMNQLARVAKEKESKALDMQGIYQVGERMKDYWYKLFCEIQTVDSLTELRLGKCDPDVITLFEKVSLGRTLNSLSMQIVNGLSHITPEIFNTSLNSLVNLKKLCLNVYGFNCSVGDTKKVLNAVASLEMLRELELINFIVTEEFPSYLSKCTRLKKFSITPILSPLPYQIVINGVVTIRSTLTSFTLGVYRTNLVPSQDIQISESSARTRAARKSIPPPVRISMECACLDPLNCFVTNMRIHNLTQIRTLLSKHLPNMKKKIVVL